jgi:hypothetical protein
MRIALLAILVTCACDAVPDVTYSVGDGAIDAPNTCPDQVPAYATACCGPIACNGSNCTATCTDCVAKCTLAQLCCPTVQDRAVCKTNLQCLP